MSHICNTCGRGFQRLSGLGRHNRTHKSPPYFHCSDSQCDMGFNRKVEYVRHVITHKPNYKTAVTQSPFKLQCIDPTIVSYPEVINCYQVRKIPIKHDPILGEHLTDLGIMLKTVDKDVMPKIWDNFAKGLTATLPKEDYVRFVLHQTGDLEHDPIKLIVIGPIIIRELNGQWLAENIEKRNKQKSSNQQIKFLDRWFCLSFFRENDIAKDKID